MLVVKTSECEGQIFKAHVAFFKTKKGYSKRINLTDLKRKSCGKCPKCTWLSGCDIDNIEGFNDASHQRMYRIELTDISYNYENGLADDFNFKLVEYIEKEKF